MLRTKSVILISIFILSYLTEYAQSKTEDSIQFIVSTKFQTGSIISNNAKSRTLIKDNPILFQLDFGFIKNKQQSWNNCKCYIQNGVSLGYINFGNKKHLGESKSFSVFTEPYVLYNNKFQISLRGSAGLTYLNKIYHAVSDSNNLYYSRPISYLIQLGTYIQYSVTPNFKLSASTQFNHISNGGSRWPNWGMNITSFGIGASYLFKPDQLHRKSNSLFTDKSWRLITHVFGGRNTLDADDLYPEVKKIVTGLNLGLIKPLGRISSLGIGGEVYYDGTSELKEKRYNKDFISTVASLSLQHYITLGRLLLGEQLAFFVTKLNPDNSTRVYQRYIIEYRVRGPWYLGVSLKAHGNVSDYMALSTGYIIK